MTYINIHTIHTLVKGDSVFGAREIILAIQRLVCELAHKRASGSDLPGQTLLCDVGVFLGKVLTRKNPEPIAKGKKPARLPKCARQKSPIIYC